MDIKSLNLGADSAEKDIHIGLTKYFLANQTFEGIKSGKKTILVGNRGAGKSAIFKIAAVQEKDSNSFILELSPDEYSYEILKSTLRSEQEGAWHKQSAYAVAWQFLLYNLIFKEVAKYHKKLKKGSPIKDSSTTIYRYVRDNLKMEETTPLEIMISYLKRLEGIKIGRYEASMKARQLQSLYKLEEIQGLLPHLDNILKSHKIRIYIDELDKGWDNSEDAQYFIAGLFQAAQKMNATSPNLRVFVSIRQELFENILQIYDDAQKIREDIAEIRWTEEDLLDFISRRIKYSWPEYKSLSPIDTWQLLFTSVLEYRGTKSYNYILDRTQLRPREMLQFVKSCVDAVYAGKKIIEYQDITRAESVYSEQKVRDLASEYRFRYPNLLDIFELFRGKNYSFEKDELDLFLLEIVEGEFDVGKAEWVKSKEYTELKKILWEIGFLKAWVIGGLKYGRKGGSAYIGIYELSNVILENVNRFQVHPIFRFFLRA